MGVPMNSLSLQSAQTSPPPARKRGSGAALLIAILLLFLGVALDVLIRR